MKKYVVGFMFSEDMSKVALIRKNRPDWQKGLLNGLGGRVEPDDINGMAAMIREFEEEAGVKTADWVEYATIEEFNARITFFYSRCNLCFLRTMTDEEVEIINVAEMNNYKVIENLKWLIPMAKDFFLTNHSRAVRCY